MNGEKQISIIIPVYNCEKYLRACLDSVVNQTYRNIEIILVNDGSTDRSPQICREYARRDSRIRLIDQENGGEAAARNRGLQEATGEFLLFVDSDDLIGPEVCEFACSAMGPYDLMFLDYTGFRDGKEAPRNLCYEGAQLQDLSQYTRFDWAKSQLGHKKTVPENLNLNTVWAKLYRRSFISANNIIYSAGVVVGEDVLFNLQVFLKEPKACHLPIRAYYYRFNQESVVHRYNPKVRAGYPKLRTAMEQILRQGQLWEALREDVGFQTVTGLLQIFSSDIFHAANPKTDKEKKADFLSLLSREEYRAQIPVQMAKFGPVKRTALYFAMKEQYVPLKILYRAKDLIR